MEQNYTNNLPPTPTSTPPPVIPGQMNQTVSEYQPGGGGKKKLLIVLVVLIILGIVGFFAWRWWNGRFTEGPNNTGTTDTVSTTQPEVIIDPYPNDKDRDGISNEDEKKLGTSEIEFDTDGDSISDLDEINVWHTSPTSTDTDGDGFSDGWEVIQGYDPLGTGKLAK